jgi:hypothetical protein
MQWLFIIIGALAVIVTAASIYGNRKVNPVHQMTTDEVAWRIAMTNATRTVPMILWVIVWFVPAAFMLVSSDSLDLFYNYCWTLAVPLSFGALSFADITYISAGGSFAAGKTELFANKTKYIALALEQPEMQRRTKYWPAPIKAVILALTRVL